MARAVHAFARGLRGKKDIQKVAHDVEQKIVCVLHSVMKALKVLRRQKPKKASLTKLHAVSMENCILSLKWFAFVPIEPDTKKLQVRILAWLS